MLAASFLFPSSARQPQPSSPLPIPALASNSSTSAVSVTPSSPPLFLAHINARLFFLFTLQTPPPFLPPQPTKPVLFPQSRHLFQPLLHFHSSPPSLQPELPSSPSPPLDWCRPLLQSVATSSVGSPPYSNTSQPPASHIPPSSPPIKLLPAPSLLQFPDLHPATISATSAFSIPPSSDNNQLP